MNLFQKYGIKEVADVVFYSVTTVGDEEFYTPVLFLDTLKVSTLEKTAEKVEARGGKGNKKLITWNFGKEITLNLEDALFSPASMSMIWGGKLNSKLSDYTSAIVKGNLANKYYELNYSTKAYPSPALTDEEWEIVYQAAQEVHYNSESGNGYPHIYDPSSGGEYVSENRISFLKKYFQRNRKNIFDGVVLDLSDIPNLPNIEPTIYTTPTQEKRYTKKIVEIFLDDHWLSPIINFLEDETETHVFGNLIFTIGYVEAIKNKENYEWDNQIKFTTASAAYTLTRDESGQITLQQADSSITNGFVLYDKNIALKNMLWDLFKVEKIVDAIGTYIFIPSQVIFEKLENVVTEGKQYSDYPMPKTILNEIMKKINTLDKIGYIDTDIHDMEVIDRMEKCIVKNRNGLKISTSKQKENLFKYYADDKTSSYTIYYDVKTMLPLFRVDEQGIIDSGDQDEFTIKMGTVYYKWTRTVKYKESDDDAILGKTLVIDAETFPDAYKIVGETYIRNQKTGKDQRYQFTIHRANVSTDTSVTLEAEGDPTTFSMQIDVLTPPNDIMMELKQYDVEDDPLEGGTRIVPQKSKYTYTPANIEYIEEVTDKNEEIY